MANGRHLIICMALAATMVPAAQAQTNPSPFRIDTTKFVLQQTAPVAAQMHPAAKGAVIGAAAGAGTVGAIGLWYCTIGPSEAGECTPGLWFRAMPVYIAAGAGIGALIGALK